MAVLLGYGAVSNQGLGVASEEYGLQAVRGHTCASVPAAFRREELVHIEVLALLIAYEEVAR